MTTTLCGKGCDAAFTHRCTLVEGHRGHHSTPYVTPRGEPLLCVWGGRAYADVVAGPGWVEWRRSQP